MSEVPPGWYTDPGGARVDRYHDGTGWTPKVRARTGGGRPFVLDLGTAAPAAGAVPTGAAVAPLSPPSRVNPYGGGTVVPARADTRPRTADGERIAGWWARAAAALIDEAIQLPISIVVALPFLRHLVEVYSDLYRELQRYRQYGGPLPDVGEAESRVAGDLVAVVLIVLVVSLAYHVSFLSWRQATPGKLALGLRVRSRDHPGPLRVETTTLRWCAQFGPGLLKLVPFVSIYLLLLGYVALDRLWALWDGDRRTLHDRVARTVVVVRHRTPPPGPGPDMARSRP